MNRSKVIPAGWLACALVLFAAGAPAAPRWLRVSWTTTEDTDTTMAVSWNDSDAGGGIIAWREYGTTTEATIDVPTAVDSGSTRLGYVYEETITGLTPYTIYEYRVFSGGGWSDWKLFRTAPAFGSCQQFRMAAGGDGRGGEAFWDPGFVSRHWDNIAAQILTDVPLFMLYSGDLVHEGDILGIGGGTAVHAVVQALSTQQQHDIEVVPILGAVQGQATTDVNDLAAQLAERLGAKAFRLHAPAFVDSREQRDALLSMGPIREILDIARRATFALMGVGALVPSAARYVEFTDLTPEDMREIASSSGSVGEIAARLYDVDGQPSAPHYSCRVVGLTLEEIRTIPYTIGVAATAAKALPLYGALRGGYLNSLVTDEGAARRLLTLFGHGFRDPSQLSLPR